MKLDTLLLLRASLFPPFSLRRERQQLEMFYRSQNSTRSEESYDGMARVVVAWSEG